MCRSGWPRARSGFGRAGADEPADRRAAAVEHRHDSAPDCRSAEGTWRSAGAGVGLGGHRPLLASGALTWIRQKRPVTPVLGVTGRFCVDKRAAVAATTGVYRGGGGSCSPAAPGGAVSSSAVTQSSQILPSSCPNRPTARSMALRRSASSRDAPTESCTGGLRGGAASARCASKAQRVQRCGPPHRVARVGAGGVGSPSPNQWPCVVQGIRCPGSRLPPPLLAAPGQRWHPGGAGRGRTRTSAATR